MTRPTLDDIYAEPDEFGLLAVKPAAARGDGRVGREIGILQDVSVFYRKHNRLPASDADDHDEMRLGTIWQTLCVSPSAALIEADRLGLLAQTEKASAIDWRNAPASDGIPGDLDDIFGDLDADLHIDPDLVTLRHVTQAADRHMPDHRAEFVPCRDFHLFEGRFHEVQSALDLGDRKAAPIRKGAILEPIEGDFFIRNGLFALVAEKSEMSARGGSRDHRLRVIYSNGTESDPLMSSFRKSLTEDKTARAVERVGLGPLDPDWEADRLSLSGTIYVARSLSNDSTIKEQRMILHKIGVTSQDVRRRVADARNDPTFLLAPVEIVATFDLKNLPRNKVETLLHRFFEPARPAGLFIRDRFGKTVHPKEWFYVLPEHVSQAAMLIQDGQLHLYLYDPTEQRIVKKVTSVLE